MLKNKMEMKKKKKKENEGKKKWKLFWIFLLYFIIYNAFPL